MRTDTFCSTVERRRIPGVGWFDLEHAHGEGFRAHLWNRSTDWYPTRPALIKALVDGRHIRWA